MSVEVFSCLGMQDSNIVVAISPRHEAVKIDEVPCKVKQKTSFVLDIWQTLY
jgi:hypothetical protein